MGSEVAVEVQEEMVKDLKVVVEKTETVVPAEATEGGSFYLSNVDQVLAYYVEIVFFYAANAAKGVDDVGEVLKAALAKLLVPYHFQAGRLSLNAQEMRMEVTCNRTGVVLSTASSELALSDLGDVSTPNPAFRSLLLSPHSQALSDAPIMTAQITIFKCGGFSIGICQNHALLDGIGAINFLNNWCSIARGGGVIFPPSPDRAPLRARSPPSPSFDHPEFLKLSDISAHTTFTTTDAVASALPGSSLPKQHIFKNFPFSADDLDSLKKQALRDPAISKCSTFEAIVAHVWQARSKSLETLPDSPCKLFFAVDFRTKIHPPLPNDYAGNALVAPLVQLTQSELVTNSLAFCVGKIQQSIKSVTDEYVRSSIDWWELHRGVPAVMNGIIVAAWWKIPFDQLDFGWGKPIYVGPVVNDRAEFILLLSNGKHDGGLNVYLALLPEEMAKFEKHIQLPSPSSQ